MIEGVIVFLIRWLILSALYALVAVGFTMIFGVGGVLNLAHGAAITIGALVTFYIASAAGLGLPLAVGIAGAISAAIVFNFGLYRVIVIPVERKFEAREYQAILILIMTLLTALLVEQSFRLLIGSDARSVPAIIPGNVSIAGATVSNNLLLAFVVSWVAIGALFYFVNNTLMGRALVAATMSRRGAELVGADIDRLFLWTWIIAAVLAAIAGIFLGAFIPGDYTMGRDPLIISFAIVVLGGLGSIRGSVIGAYIIGFLEVFTTTHISPRLTGLAAFTVLILVLLLKPEGLYGRELTLGE